VATIGCANLRMKQGRGDDYILAPLTSSNSGWHRGGSTCGTTPSTLFRCTPAAPSRSRKGIGWTAPPRQSKRRCSSPTGLCLGVFGTPRSPWRRLSGSTMPEVLCRSGGGHSDSAT
jgi:hypothetical protein